MEDTLAILCCRSLWLYSTCHNFLNPIHPVLQVSVGSAGLRVSADKLRFVLAAKTDARCVRDAARLFWTPAQLLERSVTGAACRRYLKAGAKEKTPLSPEKQEAVRSKLPHLFPFWTLSAFHDGLLEECLKTIPRGMY